MEIFKLDPIPFTFEHIAEARRAKFGHGANSDIRAAREAFDEAMALLSPKAAVELCRVSCIDGSGSATLLTSDGRREKILIGPRAFHLGPAQEAAAALCTVGDKIERAISERSSHGDETGMRFLEFAAAYVLISFSRSIRREVEAAAARKGCGVGPAMKPGSLFGWPMSGQKSLHGLIRAEKIGIAADDSGFLRPLYSNSMLIGIGKGYKSSRVTSLCGECALYESCLWRDE
jgi:hypothetical protein